MYPTHELNFNVEFVSLKNRKALIILMAVASSTLALMSSVNKFAVIMQRVKALICCEISCILEHFSEVVSDARSSFANANCSYM